MKVLMCGLLLYKVTSTCHHVTSPAKVLGALARPGLQSNFLFLGTFYFSTLADKEAPFYIFLVLRRE